MVEKKYADSKTFTFKISKGLDIGGSKVINVADPTSTTDGRKKRHKCMVQSCKGHVRYGLIKQAII